MTPLPLVLVLALCSALTLAPSLLAPSAPGRPAPAAALASTADVLPLTPARRLTNGCRLTRRGVPTCGTLLGAAHGANTDPSALERRLGHRLGVRRTYFTASQVRGAVETARADLRRGRLPWMSFKLPHSWSAMAAGAGDAWARGLARRLGRLPGPVWVAFHHEPETDGDIQAWRRMQERLGPIVRSTARNVGFTVVLTGWHQLYGEEQYRLRRSFPRVRVDVAGFDVYNKLGVVKDGRLETEATDMAGDYFRPIARWAARRGVAWGLAETGISDRGSQQDPDWVRDTYRAMQRAGGVAFSYFDTELHSIAPWDLSPSGKRHDFGQALATAPRLVAGS